MKRRKQIEKWGAVVLGVLCVFLVFRLVSEILGNPAPDASPTETLSQPSSQPVPPQNRARKRAVKSPAGDPALQMQTLEEYRPRPLPEINRNPFDFGAPPVTPAEKAAEVARAAAAAHAAPPQPRIPFRAIGYSEKAGIGPEAFLADSQQVYVVRDGDVISHRYKVLRITPSMVEVQDGTSGERAQLPIPQVQ